MACDWNNDLTVFGFERTMRTLCLSACLSYAFSVELCRILRTTFVIIVFYGFFRLGTTIVPQTRKGSTSCWRCHAKLSRVFLHAVYPALASLV